MPASRYSPTCSVSRALAVLGGKWSASVVGRLAHGPSRFEALRHAVQGAHPKPPTGKVLAHELRRLEAAGVLVRTEAPGQAPRYRLTPRGEALVPLLDGLAEWGAAAPA